jgi:hypothetical protein
MCPSVVSTSAYTHIGARQTDTSIIRDKEIASGDAGPCGRTLAGGVNDMASQMEAAASAGLPSAAADGTVTMTVHQVNGDGAGYAGCGFSRVRIY